MTSPLKTSFTFTEFDESDPMHAVPVREWTLYPPVGAQAQWTSTSRTLLDGVRCGGSVGPSFAAPARASRRQVRAAFKLARSSHAAA